MRISVDTGADRTAFGANVLEALELEPGDAGERIGGIGGVVEVIVISTQIRLTRKRATLGDRSGRSHTVSR